MNLIIFNMEMDSKSPVLSHCVDWVNSIARLCNKVFVFTLKTGEYKVNENVKVIELNNQDGNLPGVIISIYKNLFKIHRKHNIGGYFVHMTPNYVPVIYPVAKIFKVKIALWYTHRSVPFLLKISKYLCDHFFSVSSESFLMNVTKEKITYTGHGIDVSRFDLTNNTSGKLKVFGVVGRITPVKNIELIVDTFIKLMDEGHDIILKIAGDSLTEDDIKYRERIQNRVKEREYEKKIIFKGNISPEKIPAFYNEVDATINLCDGGLDKVILESMASGVPVITSNKSARELFSGLHDKGLFFTENNLLFNKLKKLLKQEFVIDRESLTGEIRQKHSLEKLSKTLYSFFQSNK